MLRRMHLAAVLLVTLLAAVAAQDMDRNPREIITYEEVMPKDPNAAYIIGEAVASEFDRQIPVLSDNLRGDLNGMRNDINRQFESLKHYMDNKLDRMERDAPSSEPIRSNVGSIGAAQSPEAMIRHNLAMAELRRLGADLTKAMNEEVGKLREEFRNSLDLLREQVENSTQGMATNLQGEFTLRAEESVNMLKKVFFLTRSQMAMIQEQLSNISTALSFPELQTIVDPDPVEVVTLVPEGGSTAATRSATSASTPVSPSSTTTSTPTTTIPPEDLPEDCLDAKNKGFTTGVTTIKVNDQVDPQKVWCDQETDGGGWIVMLRRQHQPTQLNFRQDWDTYRAGFGEPSEEYWIGLETLYQLTMRESFKLRVDMRWEDEEATSLYDFFSVGPQRYNTRGYKLDVGGYNESSTGGDAMEYHNGMDFSTYDEDNDGASGGSCAEWSGGGGWWYNYCFYSNPTGIYAPDDLPPNSRADHFLEWRKWQGYYTYLSNLVMLIKRN